MSLVRAILALVVVLAAQAALGRLWPAGHRYIDFHLLPVIWYGVHGSQRQAIVVGCFAGWIQDAWFSAGAFGISGLRKSLLGWGLGAIGSRVDLNGAPGCFAAAASVALIDGGLGFMIDQWLDQATPAPGLVELLIRVVATGLLAVLTFPIVEKVAAWPIFGRSH